MVDRTADPGHLRQAAHAALGRLETALGGARRARVILLLAAVLALSSADGSTVGASAVPLRNGLDIGNTEIGLLVSSNLLVGAVMTLPAGVLVDRVRRTRLLGVAVLTWGVAMLASAFVGSYVQLLVTRCLLGLVTAVAAPAVASLLGDWFHAAERGRVYGWVLAGELVGTGVGFAVTGDVAALSWRAAFVVLALPAFALGWAVLRTSEPDRGGTDVLPTRDARPHDEGGDPAGDAGTGGGPGDQTEVQRLARRQHVRADPDKALEEEPAEMGLPAVVRHVLAIRTNVVLIVASACGYFVLSGITTFGVELTRLQYGVGQLAANGLLLLLGVAAISGVLLSGRVGDALLHRGRLDARLLVAGSAGLLSALVFLPALLVRSLVVALPLLAVAGFLLAAQNPPLDAARLDVVPGGLWGRAEGVRTVLRSGAQALSPVAYGFVADTVFGGGRAGLQWAFVVLLLPLAAGGVVLLRGRHSYPQDVATAAAPAHRRAAAP